VLASNLQLFALNFIAGSVYQMMRGGTIITTFIFSLIILKMKAKLFQIVGSALAFIGIAIVGVSAMVFSNPSDS
jgi:drug/metabolite transporter (DMT)-like permease